MQWSFSFVSAEAKAELDALPADMRASFERIVQLVQAVGLERVHGFDAVKSVLTVLLSVFAIAIAAHMLGPCCRWLAMPLLLRS